MMETKFSGLLERFKLLFGTPTCLINLYHGKKKGEGDVIYMYVEVKVNVVPGGLGIVFHKCNHLLVIFISF